MKRILALVCFAVLTGGGSVCASGQTSNETRYTILTLGNKAGFETSKRNADGSLELYYEFNDRGRGPKITERVILDSNGQNKWKEVWAKAVLMLRAGIRQHSRIG
jgi:hypothetical protein